MSDSFDTDEKGGKLLTFPGGQQLDPNDLGAPYIVGQGGHVPTVEILDPKNVKAEIRERESYVRNQELVQAIESKAPVTDVIDEVLKEIAEELSHLKYERRKAASEGKNTANYTVSRIASLRSLADVLMKRMENARQERLDLRSPKFKQVLHLWMQFVYDSMVQSGMNEGTIDAVFKTMESNMTDWERRISDNIE